MPRLSLESGLGYVLHVPVHHRTVSGPHIAVDIIEAFEAGHGEVTERTLRRIAHHWPIHIAEDIDIDLSEEEDLRQAEIHRRAPNLATEEELVSYLIELRTRLSTPLIIDIVALVVAVFETETVALQDAGEAAFIDRIEDGDLIVISLKVYRQDRDWLRHLFVLLHPSLVPQLGVRILDRSGELIADIGGATELDADVALALVRAGIVRLRDELS